MIIDLRLDGFKHSLVELDNPKPISEIVRATDISTKTVLSYKINHRQYVNDEYVPAQNTMVDCITYKHPEGSRIYHDSVIFVMAKAAYNILGENNTLVVEHSVGDGVFCEFFGDQLWTADDCTRLLEEMQRIVENDIPIDRIEVRTEEALDIFGSMGRKDLVKNLKYNYRDSVDLSLWQILRFLYTSPGRPHQYRE